MNDQWAVFHYWWIGSSSLQCSQWGAIFLFQIQYHFFLWADVRGPFLIFAFSERGLPLDIKPPSLTRPTWAICLVLQHEGKRIHATFRRSGWGSGVLQLPVQTMKEQNTCPLPLAWRVNVGQSLKSRWMNLDITRVTSKVGSPSGSG